MEPFCQGLLSGLGAELTKDMLEGIAPKLKEKGKNIIFPEVENEDDYWWYLFAMEVFHAKPGNTITRLTGRRRFQYWLYKQFN